MKEQNSELKKDVHYHEYLGLDAVLNAQFPLSGKLPDFDFKPADNNETNMDSATTHNDAENIMAHEEMLFIIVHQVYELWFKQILFDVDSIRKILNVKTIPEEKLIVIFNRLKRVIEIQKLLVQQIQIIETMTPSQFLDFRGFLGTASGFQSFQFRQLELALGLDKDKIELKNKPPARFTDVLTPEQTSKIKKLQSETDTFSLFKLIEKWLENTPFLSNSDFDFIQEYKEVRKKNFEKDINSLSNDHPNRNSLIAQRDHFLKMFSEDSYNELKNNPDSKIKLSYKARNAALFIMLYSDRPILNLPNQVLLQLIQLDELLSTWRYRHSVMVLKMLGRKIGTGGSKGYDYLMETVNENRIFSELANLSSELIGGNDLPKLDPMIEKNMKYQYSLS